MDEGVVTFKHYTCTSVYEGKTVLRRLQMIKILWHAFEKTVYVKMKTGTTEVGGGAEEGLATSQVFSQGLVIRAMYEFALLEFKRLL